MVETKSPILEKVIKESFKEGKKSIKIKKKKSKSKKLFKRPQAKGIKKLSATKLIQQMGREQGALVREVENPYADPIQDNRSQFFRAEFEHEKKKAFGGFL